jgi:hypothetical protein
MRALGNERKTMHRRIRLLPRAAALLPLAFVASRVAAQSPPGPLFPEPFRVEHRLIQDDGDGARFEGEPVVDTYGGSWIVSQRPDGSRVIVDLARRELTEVRPEKGTYWTLSFDRFSELQYRMRAARTSVPEAGAETTKVAAGAKARPLGSAAEGGLVLVVTEEAPGSAIKAASGGNGAVSAPSIDSPAGRPGVKHFRVARKDAPTREGALEVWVDPSIRLSPAAVSAVAALESDVLAMPGSSEKSSAVTASAAPGRYLAAARVQGAGALPVRTVRPAAQPEGFAAQGRIEDVATKVERLERFPGDLVAVPEGLRRTPHPLEAVVRFLDEEAERNAAMSDVKTKGNR